MLTVFRYIYTMICVAALCRTSSSPLLKLNTAMTYKIGTKALSAILDALKLIRSPPVDSCSEYDPNDYSNLEESKAYGLSCSPIKVPVLIWLLIACVLHMLSCISSTLLHHHLLSLLIIYVEPEGAPAKSLKNMVVPEKSHTPHLYWLYNQ